MDTTILIPFLMISTGLILIPGPNVLVIIATSIEHGRARGLQTVAGTTLAMALQLMLAALGTAWLVRLLAEGFAMLKWLGVAWLLYLGISHLKRLFTPPVPATEISGTASFSRGFVVSLTNPKTIVFFTAFMPQFVVGPGNYLQQIMLLSVIFLCLAALLDSTYAILASRCRSLLTRRYPARMQNGISGLVYLLAGTWLALARRD